MRIDLYVCYDLMVSIHSVAAAKILIMLVSTNMLYSLEIETSHEILFITKKRICLFPFNRGWLGLWCLTPQYISYMSFLYNYF